MFKGKESFLEGKKAVVWVFDGRELYGHFKDHQQLLQFFQKFLCVARLDEAFAEQFLQALQVMAAIVFKDDHLLEAITVAQQELQIIDVRLRETVTDKVNLFGVFQVVIGLGP